MKSWCLRLIYLLGLAGCGAETVGTAAVQAEARQREIEEAKRVEDAVRKQAEAALQQGAAQIRAAESNAQ